MSIRHTKKKCYLGFNDVREMMMMIIDDGKEEGKIPERSGLYSGPWTVHFIIISFFLSNNLLLDHPWSIHIYVWCIYIFILFFFLLCFFLLSCSVHFQKKSIIWRRRSKQDYINSHKMRRALKQVSDRVNAITSPS